MTARWVVDEVRPHRDLQITWQPISLLFKNQPEPGSEGHERLSKTHGLLRVIESVRAEGGADAERNVESLYWEYGRRIHHDKAYEFTAAEALESVGLDPVHAKAFDDESWDDGIRTRMGRGITLAGETIGTPIIGLTNSGGDERAYFGPVITRVLPTEDSLRLWDALSTMMELDGFWELKRTRTERPEFGDRP